MIYTVFISTNIYKYAFLWICAKLEFGCDDFLIYNCAKIIDAHNNKNKGIIMRHPATNS